MPTDEETKNLAIVTEYFTEYWGNANPSIVDTHCADNFALNYPMHGPRHGREAAKRMLTDLKQAKHPHAPHPIHHTNTRRTRRPSPTSPSTPTNTPSSRAGRTSSAAGSAAARTPAARSATCPSGRWTRPVRAGGCIFLG